jgi:hypothetical protein
VVVAVLGELVVVVVVSVEFKTETTLECDRFAIVIGSCFLNNRNKFCLAIF